MKRVTCATPPTPLEQGKIVSRDIPKDVTVWWPGIRGGNLRNETVLAEPFRSRDDLLPEQPFRLNAQRRQARPDSTTKQAKGEEDVYAKVSKPNPLQKNKQERLEDYENVSVAHASKFPNPLYDDDDSDTSDDEVDVSYAQVTFTPQPGSQKDDTDSSTSDDDEIQFSDNKFNEGDANYTQVKFTPKPGHMRDNTDSSTSDDDEIQFSDDKFDEGDVNYTQH
ncbi:hypothetical protein INR49_001473 [Caranx melampygus]|nr:hypothetical protein INR49_001473 [Caranx melampygus]